MKMTMQVDIFTLRRLHPKLGESIAWEVLNKEKTVRYGIIRRRKDEYLVKRLGWRELPHYYWLGSRFLDPLVAVGNTQKQVLRQLFPHLYKRAELDGLNQASSKL